MADRDDLENDRTWETLMNGKLALLLSSCGCRCLGECDPRAGRRSGISDRSVGRKHTGHPCISKYQCQVHWA